MRLFGFAAILFLLGLPGAVSAKLTSQQRAVLVRDLTAEFGTAKIILPRSKKALELDSEGKFDEEVWMLAMSEFGPAARLGDMVQITKVEFKGDKLVLEINYGINGGRKWWHRIQVSGTGNRGSEIGANQATHAPGGTTLAIVFDDEIPNKTAKEFKAMFKPVLDFEQRTATELYMDTIPEEFKKAIEEKQIIEGMDKQMVLLVRDRPDNKVRDFKEGVETEDWIYGKPPGHITFVTFEDGKVVRIKDSYAQPGGQVREKEPVP